MLNLGDGAAYMGVDRVSCMSGKRHTVGVRQRGGLQAACNPQATGGIRLKDIDCSGFQYVAEVISMVAILPGSNGYRRVLPDEGQLVEVIESYRFFEVSHSLLSEAPGKINRLFGRVGTVSIHEEVRIGPYR